MSQDMELSHENSHDPEISACPFRLDRAIYLPLLMSSGINPNSRTLRRSIYAPEAAERLAEQFTATWFRPPTPKEMDGLMRSGRWKRSMYERRWPLVSDRGDQVVRQRLNLKMQFLAESGAAVLEPDDAALQAYLDNNPDGFLPPAFIAFDQLLLPNEQPEVIEEIRNRLENGADPATLGSQSLLPGTLAMTPAPVVERTFGTGFYEALAILPSAFGKAR